MLLAIDIGTTNLKAGLINKQGKLCCFKVWPHPEKTPWHNLPHLNQLILNNPLKSIAISSQGPSLVALDAHLKPLTFISYTAKDSFVARHPSVFLPKINNLKENNPLLFNRIAHFVTLQDYFIYLLTATLQTSLPSNNPVYASFLWNDEQLKAYTLHKNLFPAFTPKNKILGYTLTTQVPVLLTTFDFIANLLGAGQPNPAVALNRTGTSEGYNFYQTQPVDISKLTPLFNGEWRTLPHPSGKGFHLGIVNNDSSNFYHTLMSKAGYTDMGQFLTDAVTLKTLHHSKQAIIDYLSKIKPVLHHFKVNQVVVTGGFGYSHVLNQLKQEVWQVQVTSFDNPYTELIGLYSLTQKIQSEEIKEETAK